MEAFLYGLIVLLFGIVGYQAKKRADLESELAAYREMYSEYERLEHDLGKMREETDSVIQAEMATIHEAFGAPRTYTGGATQGSALVRAAGEAAWEDLAEDRLIQFKTFKPLKKRRSYNVATEMGEDEGFNPEDLIPNLNVVAQASKNQA